VRFRGETLESCGASVTKRALAGGARNKRDNRPGVAGVGLSLRDVAGRLGLSVGAVRRLPLPAFRYGPGGRELRVQSSDLAAYLRVR
jgi:hypothetical protein